MTATPSIDLPGWMAEQLSQASPDLLRNMIQTFAEALMSAEADAVCGAGYGQRSPERSNTRNGYRRRGWDTRAGSIDLAIPRLREGSYFPEWLLERRRRAESALISVVATSYLLGVSTRRMEKLVEQLGITRLSKSQVSEMARDLDGQVEAFRTRPLDAGPYTFVAADALVMKVREDGRTVNVHALLATGVNADGYREILGLQVSSAEDGAGWLAFFRDLVARGLSGVSLVTSDAHRGLVEAIGATLPGAAWQRCPHPLRGEPDVSHPQKRVGLGESTVALGLRPARHRRRPVPVRPDPRRAGRQASRRRAAPRRRPSRHLGLHRVPEGVVAANLVQQSPRTAQSGNPPPHRRRRHLSRPDSTDTARRRRPGRTTRRMDRASMRHESSTRVPP